MKRFEGPVLQCWGRLLYPGAAGRWSAIRCLSRHDEWLIKDRESRLRISCMSSRIFFTPCNEDLLPQDSPIRRRSFNPRGRRESSSLAPSSMATHKQKIISRWEPSLLALTILGIYSREKWLWEEHILRTKYPWNTEYTAYPYRPRFHELNVNEVPRLPLIHLASHDHPKEPAEVDN